MERALIMSSTGDGGIRIEYHKEQGVDTFLALLLRRVQKIVIMSGV